MPTVEIKQETLDFLQGLVKEINGQDRRATASPYYYVIECEQWVNDENNGEEHFFDCEGTRYLGRQDAIDSYLEDYPGDTVEDADTWVDEQLISAHESLEWVRQQGQIFLTERACNAHIKANRHHYGKNVRNYIEFFWRCPEIESLFKAVAEVAGIPFEGLR